MGDIWCQDRWPILWKGYNIQYRQCSQSSLSIGLGKTASLHPIINVSLTCASSTEFSKKYGTQR